MKTEELIGITILIICAMITLGIIIYHTYQVKQETKELDQIYTEALRSKLNTRNRQPQKTIVIKKEKLERIKKNSNHQTDPADQGPNP